MRIIHWLFVVSVAQFVCGIGFVIAGARAAREAPARAVVATATPVASVKQIMKGIVEPAATTVFDSVVIAVTIKGTEVTAPRSEEEWEAVGNSAAALIESGNLLLLGSRAVDQGDWVKYSQELIESGKAVLKATQAKSPDAILASGDTLNKSCDHCHMKYQRGS